MSAACPPGVPPSLCELARARPEYRVWVDFWAGRGPDPEGLGRAPPPPVPTEAGPVPREAKPRGSLADAIRLRQGAATGD